jgi:hypothetical protein
MNFLNVPLGWMFLSIAALFAFGVSPRFARRFYPEGPGLPARLAAPALFTALSVACFLGMALPALVTTVALGTIGSIHHRHKLREARADSH